MGIFNRAPRRDPEHAPRDPVFAFLSEDEGALLRRQMREALAERGLEAEVVGEVAVDSAGRRYGLGNLAAVCHNDRRGVRAWPVLVRQHVDKVLRLMDAPSEVETLPVPELRRRLLPRLMPREAIPDLSGFGYADEVSPGLLRLFALDLPESVLALKSGLLERVAQRLGGLGKLDLELLAEDNLRALPVERHEVLGHGDGLRVDLLSGESFFTASRALDLGALAPRLTGQPIGPDGALVAFPFRHLLAFHAIRDAGAIESLNALARLAAARHADSPGPVRPEVFWWRAGTLTPITEVTDGQVRVVVGAELQRLLERLVTGGPGANPKS